MDPTTLPTGGCNYRDLYQSAATTCGCQRFWLRKNPRKKKAKRRAKGCNPRVNRISEDRQLRIGNGGSGPSTSRPHDTTKEDDYEEDEDEDEEEFGSCQCGHHACFHSVDQSPRMALAQSAARRYSLQISDTETSIRLGHSASLAASGVSATSGTTTERDPYSSTTTEQSPSVVAARRIKSQHQPSQLARDRSGLGSQPPLNQAEVISSLMSLLSSNMQPPAQNPPAKSEPTPGSNDHESMTASVTASTVTAVPPPVLAEINSKIASIDKHMRSVNERLETVETFGSVLEEIREKVELTEDRVNEAEEKVLSFENRQDDRLAPLEAFLKSRSEKQKQMREANDGARRRRRREREGLVDNSSRQEVRTSMSFTSTTSTSTSFSGSSPAVKGKEADHSRLVLCIEGLESRILELEGNAPPSHTRPWIVEVVLLPPAPLRGIWIDPSAGSDAGTQHESSNPQSTGTNSGLPYSRKVWGEPDTSGRLVPRSFSVNSKLYRRLYSRGFVRKLVIFAGAARDVSAAIEGHFANLLDWCSSFEEFPASPPLPSSIPTATTSAWQPLRKVHKQTALEFLRPGEMVDGIWDSEFLRGTCLMRGRRKVLYITPHLPPSASSTISWHDIRALPKYTPTPIEEEVSHESPPPTTAASPLSEEELWAFRDSLDGPLTISPISTPRSPFSPFRLDDDSPPSQSLSFPLQRKRKADTQTPPPASRRRVGNVLRSCSFPLGPGVNRRVAAEWELNDETLEWFAGHPAP